MELKRHGENWIPLSVLKQSNPVDVAENAEARNPTDLPDLKWWIPYTFRKRNGLLINVSISRGGINLFQPGYKRPHTSTGLGFPEQLQVLKAVVTEMGM